MKRKIISFGLIPPLAIAIIIGCVLSPGFKLIFGGAALTVLLWGLFGLLAYTCPFWPEDR